MIFGRETGEDYNKPLAEVIESEDGVLAEADAQYVDWMANILDSSARSGMIAAIKYFAKHLPQNTAIFWNNLDLVAVAKDDGSLSKINAAAYGVQERFSTAVLPKMVKILNPDVVIFLTSSSRDAIIIRNFGVAEADFVAFDDVHGSEELAEIMNFPGAKLAYRANHPAPGKSPLKNDVKDSIIADIKENFKD